MLWIKSWVSTPWNGEHCFGLLHFLQYDWCRWLSIPYHLPGTQPTIQDKRSTKKVPERSSQRAMYAFDWSSQYQPDCDEKNMSFVVQNGAWTTICVTTRSSSYLYRASWQSWIHADRWKLLFLQSQQPGITEDKKKLCCLHAACLQRTFNIKDNVHYLWK